MCVQSSSLVCKAAQRKKNKPVLLLAAANQTSNTQPPAHLHKKCVLKGVSLPECVHMITSGACVHAHDNRRCSRKAPTVNYGCSSQADTMLAVPKINRMPFCRPDDQHATLHAVRNKGSTPNPNGATHPKSQQGSCLGATL